MGPGLNSFVERELLREKWPTACDFWDQPQVTGDSAYRDLIDAALSKAETLSEGGRRKIDLIAHSFGGHLARECVEKMGETVNSVRLISTGHDPTVGFHRLLGKLSIDGETPAAVRDAAQALLARYPIPDQAPLWEMVGLIVQDPAFMRLYWPSRNHYDAYLKASARAPQLAFQTFQDVLNDFSRNGPPIPSRISWKGKAELILGSEDPLIDPTKVRSYWETCFSNLKVSIQPHSGHYPHLENVLLPVQVDEKL